MQNVLPVGRDGFSVNVQIRSAHFKEQSYCFYTLMATQGNRFYFTHKVDKRGRIYSHGYHINPQGSAFKKAMLELSEPELIEGVPG